MLPSERMTVTLWPLLVSGRSIASPGLAAPILDVAASNVAVRQIRLEVTDSAQSGDTVERHWRLTVDRPTHSTEQVYRISRDGAFLGMQEMMPLLWLRELAPVAGAAVG